MNTSDIGGPIIAFESSAIKPIRAVVNAVNNEHVNVKKG